jgi:hypothetical protein
MAADTSDSDEDLLMMRIIGNAREGQPERHVLGTEVSSNDLDAGFETAMLLRKVIKKGFPIGSLNRLSHGMSPDMSMLVETMRSKVTPGFASAVSALCAPARDI